jgi:hypothetical protein
LATWEEVRQLLFRTRTIKHDVGRAVVFTVNGPEGRSQDLWVMQRRTTMELDDGPYTEEWAVIESPVGRVGELPLELLMRSVDEMDLVCGGIGVAEGHYTLRHAVPLSNLDANEIQVPILVVAGEADRIEASVMPGADRF